MQVGNAIAAPAAGKAGAAACWALAHVAIKAPAAIAAPATNAVHNLLFMSDILPWQAFAAVLGKHCAAFSWQRRC
jgi:hypothetical protein